MIYPAVLIMAIKKVSRIEVRLFILLEVDYLVTGGWTVFIETQTDRIPSVMI